jgi:hypothetical protein
LEQGFLIHLGGSNKVSLKDKGKTDFRNQVVPKTGIGFVGEDQLSAC